MSDRHGPAVNHLADRVWCQIIQYRARKRWVIDYINFASQCWVRKWKFLNNFNVSCNILGSLALGILFQAIWSICNHISKILCFRYPRERIPIQQERFWIKLYRSSGENHSFRFTLGWICICTEWYTVLSNILLCLANSYM